MIEFSRRGKQGQFKTRIGELHDDGILIGQTVSMGDGPVHSNRLFLTWCELNGASLSLEIQARKKYDEGQPCPYSG